MTVSNGTGALKPLKFLTELELRAFHFFNSIFVWNTYSRSNPSGREGFKLVSASAWEAGLLTFVLNLLCLICGNAFRLLC